MADTLVMSPETGFRLRGGGCVGRSRSALVATLATRHPAGRTLEVSVPVAERPAGTAEQNPCHSAGCWVRASIPHRLSRVSGRCSMEGCTQWGRGHCGDLFRAHLSPILSAKNPTTTRSFMVQENES